MRQVSSFRRLFFVPKLHIPSEVPRCQSLGVRYVSAIAGEGSPFTQLEHRNWEKAASPYERGWGPLTKQCVPALLKRVYCRAGCKLLDAATGPGFVAEEALELGADVTALDFSSEMLRLAESRLGGKARLVEGDAKQLPFLDESFDAVVMSFGVLHLDEPEAFFSEARRVLRPGGLLAFTVWAAPPKTEAMALILRAVKEFGNPDVPLPPGPPFFRFADPSECAKTLVGCGLSEVSSEEIAMTMEAVDPAEIFVNFRDATGRTAALLAGQTPEQLSKVEAAMLSWVEDFRVSPWAIRLSMPCVLTSAKK